MNINGPSLRLAVPPPDDDTTVGPGPLDAGTLPPMGDAVVGELNSILSSRGSIQSILQELNAVHTEVAIQVEMLLAKQHLTPEKRAAMLEGINRQLSAAFDKAMKAVIQIADSQTRSENLVPIVERLHLIINSVYTMAASLAGTSSGTGKRA